MNRWGELGVERNEDVLYTSRFNGEPVKHDDEFRFFPGTRPFSLRRLDPAALSRAMREIRTREPAAVFEDAHAYVWFPRDFVGVDHELQWNVRVRIGKRVESYETDPRGRL